MPNSVYFVFLVCVSVIYVMAAARMFMGPYRGRLRRFLKPVWWICITVITVGMIIQGVTG